MSGSPPVIVWFRQDLRLHDNPALYHAVQIGAPVLPVYILDDINAGQWAPGAAARWWLHHSLHSLNQSLDNKLVIKSGDAGEIIPHLIHESGAGAIYWNRCYEPWRVTRDKAIKQHLKSSGIDVQTFNGQLLYEPWNCLKSDGTPYMVFTPFYKKGCWARNGDPAKPLPAPDPFNYAETISTLAIDDLALLPTIRWDKKLEQYWEIGEAGAQERLESFIDTQLAHYKDGRNLPGDEYVSRLSPRFHHGELSPRLAWHAARTKMAEDPSIETSGWNFLSELCWREFSYNQLYYLPELPDTPMQDKFRNFPWQEDEKGLKAWQRGETGYPIVDAAMRQLWEEGYMHNRCRMIVGSFLVKDQMIHWRHGERWFWDCLVDADLASNAASWQWVAGCGADAAPYFRIFNPVTQGKRFDPEGRYVRNYVPELAEMPAEHIHAPWEAPQHVLDNAGVRLDATYPAPILDHKTARQKALAAFEALKKDAG